jgi:3-hydroxyisobutyrate dehydrogenase
MVPSSPHVREVYSGSSGIIQGLRSLHESAVRETLCIDSTTLDVDVARAVALEVNNTGAQMIDAPVSGGMSKL